MSECNLPHCHSGPCDYNRRAPSEREKAREAVIEAAKQKYRSLVYTSGVSQEFADSELVKAVKELLAPRPA